MTGKPDVSGNGGNHSKLEPENNLKIYVDFINCYYYNNRYKSKTDWTVSVCVQR